jgi:hypothetical protein
MLTRASDKTWAFGKPLKLEGVDRELPAGSYRVTTDEELIAPADVELAKEALPTLSH